MPVKSWIPDVDLKELYGGGRFRDRTEKHITLARFTVEHQSETLAVRLAAWNNQHPEWSYATVQHFGGDSVNAVRREEEARVYPIKYITLCLVKILPTMTPEERREMAALLGT